MPPARIAIIGGGIAGLSAAYDLTRSTAHQAEVTVYEGSQQLGGLAAGFKGRPEWEWPLEHFYHHLFTNDDDIIGLTREIGLEHLLDVHRPTTVMHIQGENHPFDSPLRLLLFSKLSLINRLRMGVVLAYLKYHPRPPWQAFDKLLADEWLARQMGKSGYEMVWRPMLQGKFGPYYDQVNLAWFWARIYKRTPRLAYYRGGFQSFVDGLAARVRQQGTIVETGVRVQGIHRTATGYRVEFADRPAAEFDKVISTTSPALMERIAPDLPESYLGQLRKLVSIGAVVLTVALDRALMQDTYWVNLPKRDGFPFLALVEHTNMIDPSHYAGDHLLYLGDYLPPDHRYFDLSATELLAEFSPYLARINPAFQPSWVTGAWLHTAKYAQPVPPVGYAQMIPNIRTPLAGLYFASMSQVYPWDRGTNYAVEIGRRVAGMVLQDGAIADGKL
jgi:protoporphyrinogen oxidase